MAVGLDRPLSKFTMKVKNFKDTKWNKKHQPLPCFVMEKKDGVNCVIIFEDGEPTFYTREGKLMQNMGKFADKLRGNTSLCDMVINCEVCNPYLSLEELGAIIKSSRKKPLSKEDNLCHTNATYLAAFDMVTKEEFINGTSDIPFHKRLEVMQDLLYYGFVFPVTCYCDTEEKVNAMFEAITNMDGEGVVRIMPDSPWVAGYKNHYKTKMVCGYDTDLEVVGVEEGEGKRAGMVANLILRWRKYGDVSNPVEYISVDGRMDDATRIEWFSNPKKIIGKVVHVHALKVGSQGGLRLAKVHEVRIDKGEADL